MDQRHSPTLRELFIGFLLIGLQGFGGVLPWARYMLVDKRRWLTEDEFTEVLGLGQVLPGPNVVNVSVVVGARFGGAAGSLVSLTGLMLAPFAIAIALVALYDRFSGYAPLRHALAGVAAVAPGLVLAVAWRMLRKLEASHWVRLLFALTFAAIAWLRLPLWGVLAALLPVGVALGYLTDAPGKQA